MSEEQICRSLKVIEGVLVKVLQRNRTNRMCVWGGIKERDYGVTAVTQKDWWYFCSCLRVPALPQLRCSLKMWLGSDPRPGNFHKPQVDKKKENID